MTNMNHDIFPWDHTTGVEEIILWSAFIFFVAGVTSMICIFLSRMVKSFNTRRRNTLQLRFNAILNSIIVNESISETGTSGYAFQYWITELRQIGKSHFSQNVLIEQLIGMKKNLTGRSASTLEDAYLQLDLQKRSLRKLNSFQWNVKARGIRELAEMKYRQSLPRIYGYLRSKNQILREESLLAIVRLDGDDPLKFLNTYNASITSWMRIHLYHFLQKLDSRKLPEFSRWFQHPNATVAIFSISMARKFRQSSAVSHLMPLLHSKDHHLVSQAIEALGDLDAYQKAGDVAACADAFQDDPQILIAVARCLTKIGDNHQTSVITKLTEHPNPAVRFEALKALANIDRSTYEELKIVNQDNHVIINAIKHLEEPLLQ